MVYLQRLSFLLNSVLSLFHQAKLFSFKKHVEVSPFDKALWASLFFFLISQLADIQYFDGKISTVMWVLMAALKKIIEGNNKQILKT